MNLKSLARLNLNYIYLVFGLIFVPLIYTFRQDSLILVQLIIGGTCAYVAIALTHHHLDKSLTLEIIIEYILIALLVVVLLQGQVI